MFAISRGREEATPLSKYYDDIMMAAKTRTIRPKKFSSWPSPFLLPIVCVKMKIMKELRCNQQLFDLFSCTSAGQCLEQVSSHIQDFLVGENGNSNWDFTTRQERATIMARRRCHGFV